MDNQWHSLLIHQKLKMVLPTDQLDNQWHSLLIHQKLKVVLPTNQLDNQWHSLLIHQKFSYGHLLLLSSLPVLLSFDFYGLSGPLVWQPAWQMWGQPAATGTGLSVAPANFPMHSGGDEEEGPLRLRLHDHCQQEVLLGWLLGELQLTAQVVWGLVDQ